MMSETMLAALILLFLANPLPFIAGDCLNSQNYSDNSPYRVNLGAVLSDLPVNISRNGFYNGSAGRAPDRVNAMALCRGDIELDPCRDCIRSAIAELRRSCPYRKKAITWSNDECMVRYSDVEIFTTLATSPVIWYWNLMNATNPDEFEADLNQLLEGLRLKAVDGGFERKVAGGNTTGPYSHTIYALVQCTPDLSPSDCDECLIDAARQIPSCCKDKRGGRVISPSCYLRFETYRFFDEKILQIMEAPPPAAEPSASPVPQPPVQLPTGNSKNLKTRNIIIIAVTTVVGTVAAVIIVVLIFLRRREPKSVTQPETETMDEISSSNESLQFDFTTISTATNGFSDVNKLGQGGFGAVYKGILPNGQEIAVKRLSKNSRQGSLEFNNEVLLLARLQHKNLVRLLGFCLQGMEKLLVYEFIPNGSLDQFIFDPVNHSYLNWDRRHKIITGIARALLYLHENSRLKIIHRDLKAGNVLLDHEMKAKVADFGLAKLFGQDESQGNTRRVVGTFGYMPPEYVTQGQFSVKYDVFSFGVLILEIISGQRRHCVKSGEEYASDLISFAWESWRNGMSEDIVDPFLRSSSSPISNIRRYIHIGLLCVQKNAASRPTMASVVLMLGSISMTLPASSEMAFYLRKHSSIPRPSLECPQAQPDEDASKNDASISELYPR